MYRLTNAVFHLALALLVASCGSQDPTSPTNTYGRIKGKVSDAVTLAPIPKALITSSPATASLLATTEGAFELTQVPPGTYQVFASKTGYALGWTVVRVQAGAETEANVLLSQGSPGLGLVSGVVRNEAGVPIEGALIQTIPATSTALTNAEGVFLLAGITPRTYVLGAEKLNVGSADVSVLVEADKVSIVDLVLRPQNQMYGRVSGQVISGTTSLPLKGALVQIVGDLRSATTDVEGRFTFDSLAAGTVRLVASGLGLKSVTVNADVVLGQNTFVTITMGASPPPITAGLMLHFPLNGSGAEVTGNVTQSYTGAVEPVMDRKGNPAGAVRFTGQVSSYISASTNRETWRFPLTISFWMKRGSNSSNKEWLLSQYLHPTGNGIAFFIEGSTFVQLYSANNFSSYLRNETGIPATDSWHHVCFVLNASEGSTYIDGQFLISQFWTGQSRFHSSGEEIRIGFTRSTGTGDVPVPFNGQLDDILWFDRALTPQEVMILANDT